MKKRTKTGAAFMAIAVMALLTPGVDARAVPGHGMPLTTIGSWTSGSWISGSWFSDLWSLLGDNWRCSRCHG